MSRGVLYEYSTSILVSSWLRVYMGLSSGMQSVFLFFLFWGEMVWWGRGKEGAKKGQEPSEKVSF